jgi:hypothetical protein
MNLRAIDNYFDKQEEPVKGYLLFLRNHLLQMNAHITEAWKYGMPFYCYKGKMICYLWVHKKHHCPYLGIVEGKKINHPRLIQEKRARMKIMLFDPEADIPLRTINSVMKEVLKLYKDL